jgi:outer membrane protein OmpA-like peptidoglycan-associated protein
MAGVLAVATPAFALTAGNVAIGNVDVGLAGSAAGTVARGAANETLAAFDTSACVGVMITPAQSLPVTLTAGAPTLGFTAQFTAPARGAYSCTVTLRDGAAANLGTFDVTARGVAAELSVSTNALAFGEVKIVGSTGTQTFVVTNTGDAGKTLTVSAIAGSGGNAGEFSATPTSFTLGSGLTRTVTVTFDPGATGARATDLIVTSNDPVTATESIALAGAGVNPVIATSQDPTSFGTVAVGQTYTTSVAVSNSGTGTLTVSSAAITGGAGGWFTFANTPQASCVGATTCDFAPDLAITAAAVDVAITCAPPIGASGTQTRTLTFASDSAAGGDGTVTLTCTAGRPDITPSAASLAFGNVELGTMATPQTLTVTNTGTLPLTIASAALASGTQFAVTMGQAGTQTVMPNQSTSWMLACAPMVEGVLGDTFVIVSDAVNSPTLNIGLTCTGGRLVANVTSLDFGNVRAGDSVTRTFTLRNTGTVTVSGLTAMFSAQANAKGYTIDAASLPPSLAGGATATVTARFSPIDTTSGTQAGETHTVRIAGTYNAGLATMTRQITLLGDGLSSGYVFNPATGFDIGPVRWDLTQDATFRIENPNEATVRLTNVSLTPVAPTTTGEITRIDTLLFPRDLAPGASIMVSFRANPNNRLGAMAATFTVNSDLGAGANPTRSIAVTATSTTPMITADPPTQTYDFGATDVDAGMVTKDVKLTNSGNAILDVTSAAITGTGSPFTVVAVTPASVAPGSSFTATVRYDPSVVRADTGTLAVGINGVFGGTMTSTFTLQGRGIDRIFAVTEPGLFPETYRNPGSKAPVKDIIVRNTGEAPLTISAVMVTGDPVWALVDAKPVVVPGGGSTAFKVRFAPISGGKAPTGSLLITHDDDRSGGRAIIMLDGFGKNPMLSVAPSSVISLGTTAVGFPVRLSDSFPDQLLVLNSDSKAFRVRELRLRDASGESPFSLTDDLSGQDLAPGDSRRFDIVFSAATVGEFAAQLEIYLDEDTEPASVVQLSGTAVEVDVKGGGGCASGNGGSGGLLALLIGAAIAARGRRRHAGAAASAALLTVMATAAGAAAQTTRNLDLFTFRPAPATTGELLQVEAPSVGASGAWEIGLAISHAVNPLQVTTSMGDTFNLVSQRTVFDFGLAVAIADHLELGARLATFNQDGDQSGAQVRGLEPGVGTAIGDVLLHGKLKLVRAAALGVAVAGNVTLPTATDNAFAGSGKLAGSGLLLVGTRGKRLSTSANLGFGYQHKVLLGNITQGNRALAGVGASLRATNSLWLSAELFGSLAIGQRERRAASPLEALLGLRVQLTRSFGVGLGLGTGVVRGVGAPAMQGVVSLELTPNADELAPLHPPKPYVPPPDSDGDGITDNLDACPDAAEDLDGFGDKDGCPDPDNDFDGVADGDDKCPLEREDKDGVDDADGCPDVDDDGDNIPVPADRCPTEKEDKDGFEDQDGCPDLDDDRDGLADGVDKCPRQAETINGNNDEDGCPDAGDPTVLLSQGRIDVLVPLTFVGGTAKLAPATAGILGQVAATLRAHPEIARLRIGVHVNQRGARDQDLTDRRAAAIRDWMVQWGIAASRLDARGFGSQKMIVKAKRANSASINDRVEFTIMERR